MRHFFLLLLIPLLTASCGGSDNKKSPSTSSASSFQSSSLVQSSAVQSSSSVKSSSSSSSSMTTSSVTQSSAASSIAFEFKSNSFVSGEPIPIKHSCFGTEVSPQLQWEIDSPDIKGFALIMEDYDAIKIIDRPYVHWNIYKIPADTRAINEGASNLAMPAGSVEGVNDDTLARYSGPCPPEGTGTHHYFFALYALNKDNLSINATKPMMRSDFESKFKDAIIQKAEISGSYFYK